MPNTATIYLPRSTWVHIRALTNALFEQQVILNYENGTQTTLVGNGEHDHVLPNGDFAITTPANSQSPLGYRVLVTVNTMVNGHWQPSQVLQGAQSIMYYNLAMVVSEDYVDQDWNDAVVQFTWWVPPSSRDPRDFRPPGGREAV